MGSINFDKLSEAASKYSGWIGFGLGILSSILNYRSQQKTNQQLMEFNRTEADIQRQWNAIQTENQNKWNKQMVQEQNEYNTPLNQKERLEEAGLNPMYYGIDGIPSASFSAAQPIGYERASLGQLINPFTSAIDAMRSTSEIANIEAQTQKTKSETKAIDAKLPFEVESIRAQVRNSNLSSDAQEVINKYLDRQQEAELKLKDASVAQADAAVQKAFAEIEKMDYEKTTMFISWLETQEKILNLQKQRELTDKQMEELASLISLNNANAAKIGLDVKNYDDITVLGTASSSMKFGPVSVQEGEPITLAMKKAAEEQRKKLKEKQDKEKDKPKSLKDIKSEYPE